MTILEKVKQQKPLVLSLTNHVTMDFVANSLLAIGASPIMSESVHELEELMQMASALYINIGTLNEDFLQRINLAIQYAHKFHKPICFDPVGCGATTIRTQSAQNIFPEVNIVRGNASEIIALTSASLSQKTTQGVEAAHAEDEALIHAIKLSKQTDKVIVISGAKDFIVQGGHYKTLTSGSSLMKSVTGMGCALTGIIAAFRAVEPDSFLAAYEATEYFGLCGEAAAKKSSAPGSFKVEFLDALYLH